MREENLSGDSASDNNNSNELAKESPNILSPKIERIIAKKAEILEAHLLARTFRGPLPPPEDLKAYDLVVPGFAEKIVGMAHKQSNHRMKMEEATIIGDNKRAWLGLILGFVVASGLIASSTYLISEGHDIAGGILGGGTIASLVSTFVYGTNKRSEERVHKQKLLLDKEDKE